MAHRIMNVFLIHIEHSPLFPIAIIIITFKTLQKCTEETGFESQLLDFPNHTNESIVIKDTIHCVR